MTFRMKIEVSEEGGKGVGAHREVCEGLIISHSFCSMFSVTSQKHLVLQWRCGQVQDTQMRRRITFFCQLLWWTMNGGHKERRDGN